jgi:c-di-GMP-binding flagellar brake protein YcgR
VDETAEPTERRRSPRVALLAELEGHAVTLDEKVQVRELSLGGMTVETTAPLSPRLVHDFRVELGSARIIVHARLVHSRVEVRGDSVAYIAGVEFTGVSAQDHERIRQFLVQQQA